MVSTVNLGQAYDGFGNCSPLYFVYALVGNYLNEGYCGIIVPGKKLTTIETFQGV